MQKEQLWKPERGGQSRAIHALLNQIISDEGADISLMSDLEKMSEADLNEMARLIISEKTTAEKQGSSIFTCMYVKSVTKRMSLGF